MVPIFSQSVLVPVFPSYDRRRSPALSSTASRRTLGNDTITEIDAQMRIAETRAVNRALRVSCSHLGLCLNNDQLIAAKLIRKPGASDLDWLDELVD